jgi:pyruvate kinase
MINEGVDVFRLNFSYSTQDENLKLISIIVYTEIHGSTNMMKVSFI